MAEEWAPPTTVYWLLQTIADVPSGDDWLTAGERETLASLRSPKRRCDWRLGRWAAKQALARVTTVTGSPIPRLARLVVGARSTGAPYPEIDGRDVPWRLSISHSGHRGLCAVVAAPAAVGCDLERVEPRTEDFAREWFTAAEQDAIARAGPGQRSLMVTLFWSAKEAALKAIGTGLTISTQDVVVSVDGAAATAGWSPLVVHRSGDRPMAGWWRSDKDDLITFVTVPAPSRPVALFP